MFGPAPPPQPPFVYLDTDKVRAAEAELARVRSATLAQADCAIEAADAACAGAQARTPSRKFKLPPKEARPTFRRPESLDNSGEDARPLAASRNGTAPPPATP
jgi:hypothetical protein